MAYKINGGANIGYTTTQIQELSASFGLAEIGTVIYNSTLTELFVWDGTSMVSISRMNSFMAVEHVDALNDIIESNRTAGMIVVDSSTGKFYKLLDIVWTYSINDWKEWNIRKNNDPSWATSSMIGEKLFCENISQVTVINNTLDITVVDNNLLVNVKSTGDYNIVLPPLTNLPIGFTVTIKNMHDDSVTGTAYTFGSDIIEGSTNLIFFGKGFYELTKMISSDGLIQEWVLSHYSNITETKLQGKSKRFDFQNESIITLNHGLGYIPLTQVWLSDGHGGYTDISVDIDHNFVTKNSLTINIGTAADGFILYN